MKALLKSLALAILFILAVGAILGAYILQAPPVARPGPPKLQIHTRTALRGRPDVNSKPLAYTKDVYRYSLAPDYISNLNSGEFSPKLLFSADLARRAPLEAERLDAELRDGIDWEKMFADLTENVRFDARSSDLKVLLSGKEWHLFDGAGAMYKVARVQNRLHVSLPDLREAFEINKVQLSEKTEASVEKPGRQWIIRDIGYQQAYTVKLGGQKGEAKLNVFQQSKVEILHSLFDADVTSRPALTSGLLKVSSQHYLSAELRAEFVEQKIALTRKAKVSVIEEDREWLITDAGQKYRIRLEDASQESGKTSRLKVYLDVDSEWLRVQVDDNLKGWVQRQHGTVFQPPPPQLSSRQQAKARLLVLIDDLKSKIGIGE